MISHLCDVDIKGLIEEYLVLFIVNIRKIRTWDSATIFYQIFDTTIDFNNRNSGIVNKSDLAYPLILYFLLKLSIDLRQNRFRIVLFTSTLIMRVYDN